MSKHPSPSQDPDPLFHGNGTVLNPNHVTRYIYPSLCDYPLGCLRLQSPANASSRPRPQGSGSWGTDGHNFLTITNTPPNHTLFPNEPAFQKWSRKNLEKEKASSNPLARAMTRISQFRGNTVLESGKFQLRRGESLVYVIKRTSCILLGEREEEGFGREEERYVVECGKWRAWMPRMVRGKEYDCWWVRLHSLFQASCDRAFFHAREQMENVLGIAPPIVKWYPRPDIEAHVTIYHETPPPAEAKFLGDACLACSRTWFTESEYACRLECGHFLCLECLTTHIDSSAGRGKLQPNETDPPSKFFRCMHCKVLIPHAVDRTTTLLPSELPFWRWKICMRRLEKEATEYWLVRLQSLPHSSWFPEIPADWDTDRQIRSIRVYVRCKDAVDFMQQVPRTVWSMLPYGFSRDNPVECVEARALEDKLKAELKTLSLSKKVFNTKEMIDHMLEVGKTALKPVLVKDVSARLGNPGSPAGYEAYRDFLCEWTARGVFMCPVGRIEILNFMRKMERNKDVAWWKDERDVFFDP